MIDEQGYRHGVGIVLVNSKQQVFLGRRKGKDDWQFPQGGIQEKETPEQAMFRELKEEIGLNPMDVTILTAMSEWVQYHLPPYLIRQHTTPLCLGQKQKWFLLSSCVDDPTIDLNCSETPEFDEWAWARYWYPLKKIISFKQKVYRRVLKEFEPIVFAGK